SQRGNRVRRAGAPDRAMGGGLRRESHAASDSDATGYRALEASARNFVRLTRSVRGGGGGIASGGAEICERPRRVAIRTTTSVPDSRQTEPRPSGSGLPAPADTLGAQFPLLSLARRRRPLEPLAHGSAGRTRARSARRGSYRALRSRASRSVSAP